MNNDKDKHGHEDDIGCLRAIEAFYAYLDGELEDPASIAEFERHIRHCRSCYTRKEVETLLTERLKQTADAQAPAQFKDRLRKLMNEF
jgi:anti-sigma factor (TIGR02949 family)